MAMKTHAWVLGAVGGIATVVFALYALRMGDSPLKPAWVGAGCSGFVLLVCWLIIDKNSILQTMRSRSFQQSRGAILLTLVAAAIAVAINVIAVQHDVRWDITAHQRYAPSAQTLAVIRGLDRDVTIHAFFTDENGAERMNFEDRIVGYQTESTRLNLQIHDPVLSPMIADRFQVDGTHPTVVLTAGEATQRLESELGEEALTNALIRVTSDREHIICTTTGHNEIDPDDSTVPKASIVAVVIKMEGRNYRFKRPVNLRRTDGVPADCDLVLVPDPQFDWLAAELEHLAAYIGGGGQAVVLLEPDHANGFAHDLRRYGIDVGNDQVMESNPALQLQSGDESFLLVQAEQLADHPITRPVKAALVLGLTRTVRSTVQPVDGIRVTELFKSSGSTWAETTPEIQPQQADPAVDPVGSLGLAALAEITHKGALTIGARSTEVEPGTATASQQTGGRIVVFGDTDFTSDRLLDNGGNLDILQNTIAWMVGEANQVSIRPNPFSRGAFTMRQEEGWIVLLVSLLVVPGIAIGGGIATWLARRRR